MKLNASSDFSINSRKLLFGLTGREDIYALIRRKAQMFACAQPTNIHGSECRTARPLYLDARVLIKYATTNRVYEVMAQREIEKRSILPIANNSDNCVDRICTWRVEHETRLMRFEILRKTRTKKKLYYRMQIDAHLAAAYLNRARNYYMIIYLTAL